MQNADFAIKDHTGVQLGSFIFGSAVDGAVLSNKQFGTTKAVIDYTWVGKSVASGASEIITVYFEIDKSISIYDTVIVLEVDLSAGANNGVDIVLANRTE